MTKAKKQNPQRRIDHLENELANALETLRAIQSGEVDALIVSAPEGEKIFTLTNADLPYRILVETMNEGAATISEAGLILYCNRKFAEMVGNPLDRVIGRKLMSFISDDDLRTYEESFRKALGSNAKCTLHLKAGTKTVQTLFSMSQARFEIGKGVCLVATDMTEQMLFDEAKTNIEALRIEKELRERFVSTLSHDLRSPLTAIKTSAQIVVRYPNQLEKHQMLGNRIIHSVERADKMIQNLLDANLIRAGEKLPLTIVECDLRQTAEEVITEIGMTVGERFILKGNSHVVGFWSCDELRRVFENLLTNAVKYGDHNAKITVDIFHEKSEVIFSVHNEGNPLSPAEQKNLFEPFSRTSSAFSSGMRGWGLGLTLVRGVVEAHGGEVTVTSSPAGGTTFFVRLPRDARPHQNEKREARPQSESSSRF